MICTDCVSALAVFLPPSAVLRVKLSSSPLGACCFGGLLLGQAEYETQMKSTTERELMRLRAYVNQQHEVGRGKKREETAQTGKKN